MGTIIPRSSMSKALACFFLLFLPWLPTKLFFIGDIKLPKEAVVSLSKVASWRLHDRTVQLRSNVTRQWFFPEGNQERPPAMLLVTNYGWNHPDQENVGLKMARSVLNRELYEGVLNHPWFHPTAWEDYSTGTNGSGLVLSEETRYYVFLDVPTCISSNYPVYRRGFGGPNADLGGGRVAQTGKESCGHIVDCHYIPQVLNSSFFKQYSAKLVVPECDGWGLPTEYRQEQNPDPRLVLVTLSSTTRQVRNPPDQGLVPPAVNPLSLDKSQRDAIAKCDESNRTFFLTFVGNTKKSQVRQNLVNQFRNTSDILVVDRYELRGYNITYKDTLLKSVFAAAPRGDAPFSYRFSEILSAASIPVVFADDWVMPFRPELVDWGRECAVIIGEQDVNSTLKILGRFTKEERCRRRKRCYEIYEKYVRTGEHVIHGIVEGLELLHVKSKATRNGTI